MCEYVSPPTIAQPVFQLGQTTATLLERIHQPAKDWEEQTLPVQLMNDFRQRNSFQGVLYFVGN